MGGAGIKAVKEADESMARAWVTSAFAPLQRSYASAFAMSDKSKALKHRNTRKSPTERTYPAQDNTDVAMRA